MPADDNPSPDTAVADAEIRALWDAQDFDAAATALMRRYGREILGFLYARMRTPAQAQDAFSAFGEAVWKALPEFAWRCSLRGWAYSLARRMAANEYRSAKRDAVLQPLSQASSLSHAVAEVRSATAPYQQTATKDRFQQLRTNLSEDDQLVLILRVDRGLSWTELAHAMLDEEMPTDALVRKEAARLRKRFQLIKGRLRELAVAEGLLRSDD